MQPRNQTMTLAALLLLTACSPSSGSGTQSTISANPESDSAVAPPVAALEVASTAPTAAQTEPDAAAGSARLGAGPNVPVEGGMLPVSLTSALTDSGGALVDPAAWYGRFGDAGLPRLSGAGVKIIAAAQVAALEDESGVWRRTDEMVWLFMSNITDLATVFDTFAAAAGIGATYTSTDTVDQGALCTQRWYQGAGDGWHIQGCDHAATGPGLKSLGISREAIFTDTPPMLDGTVQPVLATIGGDAVMFGWSVTLGRPDLSGHTLTATTDIRFPHDPTVTDALRSGPLAGWNPMAGDGSVLLTGPNGASWALSNELARLSWAGTL